MTNEPRPSGSRPIVPTCPAYLITFHTYGTWLHGRASGSVDRAHNAPGTEFAPSDRSRLAAMRRRMTDEPMALGCDRRRTVHNAIEEVATHRGWTLHALHVRTNHVHAVVLADATPERVMNDFKAWGTRRLREAGLVSSDAKVWSRHGSTRYLNDERSLEAAIRYVIEGQGAPLD